MISRTEYAVHGRTSAASAGRAGAANEIGEVAAEVDALGRRTEYAYDDRGNQTRITHPDGSIEESVYDAENNLIRQIDAAGRVTEMVYDAANRLIETVYPDGTRTSTVYDAAGQVIEEIDERGNVTRHEYDAAGQRTRTIDALGNVTRFEYDLQGRRSAVIDANGHETRFHYDANGQLLRTEHPDATETHTSYDALGRKISEADQAGLTTQFEYDPQGRLTAVIDPLGQRTEYGYDERGRQISQTDASGNTTHWEYDTLGRQSARILPLGQRETFAYNAAGQRISHTDFAGNTTTSEYDSLGRLTRRTYADGTLEQWFYDTTGNLTETRLTHTDSQGNSVTDISSYQYDARNRLTRESKPDGSRIDYSYDPAGNRTALTTVLADGTSRTVSYGYDALNRLTSVTDEQGTSTYSYNSVGSRASLTLANGVTTTYSYDSLNRLTELESRAPDNSLLARYRYTLHATGRRTRIEEDHSGRVTDYVYDDLYRLTTETITDPQHGNRTAVYQYDATGNRIASTVNGETTTWSYDANDRLTSQSASSGTTSYQYDANGNLVSETTDGQTTSYSYDSRNRMIRLTAPDGSQIGYAYDIHGIRTEKAEQGSTTRYLVDHNQQYTQVMAETDNGTLSRLYTRGDELLSQTNLVSDETRYHLHDGLGSTRALTDQAGNETDSYHYGAFGELLHQEGDSDNYYLFTGEQYDAALNHYYLRARYYSPGMARFTQQDSWMGRNHEPVTLNKYLYAHSDPVNLVDPSGYSAMLNQSAATSVQATLRLSSVNVTRINVGRVAANDAFWSTTAGHVVGARSVAHGLITSLAVTASTKKRDDNLKVPMIVFGREFLGHAQHIRDAQMGNGSNIVPAPFALNGFSEWERSWLRATVECNRGSKLRSGPGKACDEYPFASARQGGPGNYAMGGVSLRLLDGAESSRTGPFIKRFLSQAGISRDGFSPQSRYIALGIPEVRSFFTDRDGNAYR